MTEKITYYTLKQFVDELYPLSRWTDISLVSYGEVNGGRMIVYPERDVEVDRFTFNTMNIPYRIMPDCPNWYEQALLTDGVFFNLEKHKYVRANWYCTMYNCLSRLERIQFTEEQGETIAKIADVVPPGL